MIEQFTVLAVSALLTLTIAWLGGNTLAARLEREKKLTERDVAAQTEFQSIYGEFFSVWKQWANAPKNVDTATRLLPLAARVEGRYEALLVMVCADRMLTEQDKRVLGSLRQGFQQLRESMKRGTDLEWSSSKDRHYEALKVLTARVAVILRPRSMRWGGRGPARPGHAEAAGALLEVTSNEHETHWAEADEGLAREE